MVHAEFFRQLVDAIGAGNYNGASIGEIRQALIDGQYYTLYEHIRDHKDWSHNFIANYYRETIAQITQEFDTGTAVSDDGQPNQLYLDLAWRGLIGNNDTWFTLPLSERIQIENTVNNYVTNNANETCVD